MARIRAFEALAAEAHADGRLPGLLHLSIGGEAVAVGVIGQLRPDDRVYSSHRAHGHFLAAGSEMVAMFAELAGREAGLCRGRGGSMHLMDTRAVLATGVVGGTLPIAVGHALAVDAGTAVVAFFGDGAAQTGVFHESLNLAALWRTPVLFVCENNGWAEFTPRSEHTPVAHVADHAAVYGLRHAIVDGGDLGLVAEAAAELLVAVRGGGPALLECRVSRLRPHYEGDLRRPEDGGIDPLAVTAGSLAESGLDETQLELIVSEAGGEAQRALERALASPAPDPGDDAGLVFAAPLQ